MQQQQLQDCHVGGDDGDDCVEGLCLQAQALAGGSGERWWYCRWSGVTRVGTPKRRGRPLWQSDCDDPLLLLLLLLKQRVIEIERCGDGGDGGAGGGGGRHGDALRRSDDGDGRGEQERRQSQGAGAAERD